MDPAFSKLFNKYSAKNIINQTNTNAYVGYLRKSNSYNTNIIRLLHVSFPFSKSL